MSKKRISEQISPNIEDAHHFCWTCKSEILGDSTYRVVKCPKCGDDINVYATISGVNRCLEKKYVYEIKVGDFILMRDMKDYEVLNIEKFDDETYKVALKGYRVLKLREDDFVECADGIWLEGNEPWKNKE